MIKCTICDTALEGDFLTLKQDSTPLSISHADFEDFGVTNLAFECGHKDCDAVVCYRCIAKLEKERKFLSKREHNICPKCGHPFGEGGTHFLLEGWLTPEVGKGMERSDWDSPHWHWVFSMRCKLPPLPVFDLTIPTTVCCVCMSENVFHVMHLSHKQISSTNLQYTMQYSIPLCKGCHSLLTHPSIESPGLPYQINLFFPGQSVTGMELGFANPDFWDLVKITNSYLFPQK